MKKILFFVRSAYPYKTQRRDFDFIISNLITNGYQIDIYDPKQKLLMQVNDKITIDYNIFPKFLYFSKTYIPLNFLVLWRFLIKNKNKYDIVQVNYVREEYLLLPNLVKNVGAKLSLSLFGSDINDRNFIKNNFKKIYYLADSIVVTNPIFGEKIKKYIGNNITQGKISVLFLPQDHFIYYHPFSHSLKLAGKIKLNYPKDKTIVLIGTNSSPNEQHEKMIDEIKNISNPDDYLFIFLLTNIYDKIDVYVKNVQSLIEQKLKYFNVITLLKFMSYEEMAHLRLASDIYVNLRERDQLAAAMLESNLAYCHVITGDWLPYNDYLSKVKATIISDFSQLNGAIVKIVNNNSKTSIEHLEFNRQAVIRHYDTDVLNSWINYYDQL
jgi:hypothetical protein